MDTWLDMPSDTLGNGFPDQIIKPVIKDHHHQECSHQPPTEDRPDRRQWEQAFSDGPALRNNRAQKSALRHLLDEGHGCLNCRAIARSRSVAQSVASFLVLSSALMRSMLHPFVESQTPPILDPIFDEGRVSVCGLGLCVELRGPTLSGPLLLFLLPLLEESEEDLSVDLPPFLLSPLLNLFSVFLRVATSAFQAKTSSCVGLALRASASPSNQCDPSYLELCLGAGAWCCQGDSLCHYPVVSECI
jgi:hypothetical protein